ncbi:MAG: TPM domain-containing protein [Oscillospiraceae bacterium]|nr:TPM domain-containing protein [Oscillospiraceae bacterium]
MKLITTLTTLTALIALVCTITPAYANQQYLFDEAGHFSADSAVVIEESLFNASEAAGFYITVLVTEILFPSAEDSGRYAEHFYNENIGQDTSGVILLINSHGITGQMHDYIYARNNAADVITASRIERIFDNMWDSMLNENYSQAIHNYADTAVRYAEQGAIVEQSPPSNTTSEQSPPSDTMTMLFIFFVVDTIIVLGFIFGVKSAYKMSPAKCAQNYLDRDSIRYYQKSDTYIRTYVTKVKIESSSSSGGGRSGGGGGRSLGGGRSR